MTVFPMKDKPHGKPRKKPWVCELRKERTYFATRREAKAYEAKETENIRKVKLGVGTTRKDLERYTAREVVLSYAESKSSTENKFDDLDKKELLNLSKKGLLEETDQPRNAFDVLWRFATKEDICSLSLLDFNRRIAQEYTDRRLKEVKPCMVNWERMKLRKAWRAAKKWPGLIDLPNPWEGLDTIEGATDTERQRGLKKGELERLIQACKGCLGDNKFYVPLAIYLAVETGMRRQELINLTWGDIDFDNRRIKIRKSKTDWKTKKKGREIALPVWAQHNLQQLKASIHIDGLLPYHDRMQDRMRAKLGISDTDRVFPGTGTALSDAFDKVVIRAGIEDLHFHDLRAAAEGMFHTAGLLPKEIDVMKNGLKGAYDVLDIYLVIIQDKLDRYIFGKTLEQANNELDDRNSVLDLVRLCNKGMKDGLTWEESMEKVKEDRPDLVDAIRLANSRLRLRGNHQNQSA